MIVAATNASGQRGDGTPDSTDTQKGCSPQRELSPESDPSTSSGDSCPSPPKMLHCKECGTLVRKSEFWFYFCLKRLVPHLIFLSNPTSPTIFKLCMSSFLYCCDRQLPNCQTLTRAGFKISISLIWHMRAPDNHVYTQTENVVVSFQL